MYAHLWELYMRGYYFPLTYRLIFNRYRFGFIIINEIYKSFYKYYNSQLNIFHIQHLQIRIIMVSRYQIEH